MYFLSSHLEIKTTMRFSIQDLATKIYYIAITYYVCRT